MYFIQTLNKHDIKKGHYVFSFVLLFDTAHIITTIILHFIFNFQFLQNLIIYTI